MASALGSPQRSLHPYLVGSILALSFVMVGVVWMGPLSRESGFSLQKLAAAGVFAAASGLVSAIFRLKWATRVSAVATLALGFAALGLLMLPDSGQWPRALRSLLAWKAGPRSSGEEWSRLAMGLLVVICGLTLPFAGSAKRSVALAALTVLRIGLWIGVFSQLSDVALNGELTRLLDARGALAVQVAIAAGTVGCWLLLLRGDRRWLAAFTGAESQPSLARYVLPIGLAPIIVAYLIELGRRLAMFAPDVAALLNVEINAAADMLIFAAALRTIWRERSGKEALARTLQRSPVIVCSEAGVIEYWPSGCKALYGFTAEEALGRHADDLLKTSFPVSAQQVAEALRRDGEWAGDLRQETRDGETVWVSSRRVLDQPDPRGRPKIVESVTDVTDLRRRDTQLKEATESFTQAVAAYDLGTVEFDGRTGQNRYSAEFERMVGAEPGTLGTGQDDWRALLAPEDVDRMAGWIAEDMATRATRRDVTVRLRHADGSLRDAQGMLRYNWTVGGRLLRIVGIYMDVTEHLKDRSEAAERGKRLLELQSELTHVARLSAMGEMAATLAHELNQPLTAVGAAVGAIPLIVGDGVTPLGDKKRGMLLRAASHAEAQVVRAGEIVRRLRDFISRGELDTRREDLAELIEDAIHLGLPNARALGVEVVIRVSPKAAHVLASRVQIQQVLVNLTRNAVEAMSAQDTPRILTISAEPNRGMAVVRVTDTGPGVTPEVAEDLFTPFRSTKTTGMGVGLSICRRIVEAHQGKMWFECVPGVGGDFRFTLPLFLEDSAEAAA